MADPENVRASSRGRTAHEGGDPGEAHQEPDDRPGRKPVRSSARPCRGPFENRHPQGNAGDEKRRDSRGDPLLRPRHDPVAAHEQKEPDDRGGAKLPCGGRRRSFAPARPRHQPQPGHDPADRRHEERGQRLDCEADREVRRAPEDVDRQETGDDAHPTRARRAHRTRIAGRPRSRTQDSAAAP